ncbi:MAG: 30S ribosomal protein S9, partial [Candidatus Blackburnbacteria bacterium RIFCSPHIGHO2_01_FULL_44_64]
MPRKKENQYIFAVGRRKTSVARVRLHKGKDQHVINDLPVGQYFPGEEQRKLWTKPFELTKTEGKYFITVKVVGGGKRSQLGAVIHGIARSLVKLDEESFKQTLRKAGLLTRDPRMRERRKVGTGGKAR